MLRPNVRISNWKSCIQKYRIREGVLENRSNYSHWICCTASWFSSLLFNYFQIFFQVSGPSMRCSMKFCSNFESPSMQLFYEYEQNVDKNSPFNLRVIKNRRFYQWIYLKDFSRNPLRSTIVRKLKNYTVWLFFEEPSRFKKSTGELNFELQFSKLKRGYYLNHSTAKSFLPRCFERSIPQHKSPSIIGHRWFSKLRMLSNDRSSLKEEATMVIYWKSSECKFDDADSHRCANRRAFPAIYTSVLTFLYIYRQRVVGSWNKDNFYKHLKTPNLFRSREKKSEGVERTKNLIAFAKCSNLRCKL